ncbi:MAG: alginate lyase family protein, partial [Chloroflexota bacterium]
MFEPEHVGLYFGTTEIETVNTHARREPFKSALATLSTLQPADDFGAAVADGFRYRFAGDEAAAARTRDLLINRGLGLNLPTDGSISYLQACAVTMATGQAFELVRDTLPDDARRGWLSVYNQQVEMLRAVTDDLSLVDEIWRTAMKLAGAVVLERDDVFVLARDDFQRIVGTHIHPEGYLPGVVEKASGGALEQQLYAAKGLTLAAEIGTQAGADLWAFEARGISAKTAAIYAGRSAGSASMHW